MELRIIEEKYNQESIFLIQQYHDLSFYGRCGYWHRVVSYDENGLNESNNFQSLNDADAALKRMVDNIKGLRPNVIVHKTYKF